MRMVARDEGRAPPSSDAMDSRAGSASADSCAMSSSTVSGVLVMVLGDLAYVVQLTPK